MDNSNGVGTKTRVQRWLAEQILVLASVRSCLLNREADIVVNTWSATVTHIYLIDHPIKTRAIRKLIGDNSRVGVGTLFVLSAALVPPDGAKLHPDEHLLVLHALYKDKIYTYRVENDTVIIGQVHFKAYGRGDERETWYGPNIEIHTLPSYRTWLKSPNSIKGDWLVATFGNEAFWKSADYTAARDAFRQQQRRGFTASGTWSGSTSWSAGAKFEADEDPPPKSTLPPVRIARLEASYAHLGLKSNASNDEVKTAFRKLARELHPDVSKLPKAEAELRFKILNEAYTFIKTTQGW
jgi:hypothetical protein